MAYREVELNMLKYDNEIPILFIVFNRPTTTKLVFEAIRKAAPKRLYVAADGARNEQELERVLQVRAVTEQIDWPCEVRTKFSPTNLGCKMAVSSGITWFFDNEPMGIVLEDDCLPSESFFGFCSLMLEKYKNDDRISHIGGANFQDGIKRGASSYYFSRLTHVWGWAGWRRVWKKYDAELATFEYSEATKLLKNDPSFSAFSDVWLENLQKVKNQQIDTWDYQYAFLNIKQNSLSIIPNLNLVKNIGFGEGATNTTGSHALDVGQTFELTDIVHPSELVVSVEADLYTQRKEFSYLPKKKSVLSKVWKTVKNALKNEK
jgi:hypothetical protein